MCNFAFKHFPMSNGIYPIPPAINEPVLNYAPGSAERESLKATLRKMRRETIDVPMYIGGQEVRTGKKVRMSPPHDHQHLLGHYHQGGKEHVTQAIEAALGSREQWAGLDYEQRASIF